MYFFNNNNVRIPGFYLFTGLIGFVKTQSMVHIKCRNGLYPFSKISRLNVTDNQVLWNIPWVNYNPPNYTSDHIKTAPYADPDILDKNFKPEWNKADGKINRKSHTGDYLVLDGFPLNPGGRTGIKGRGILGRWGPNHAADPIVSRWKRLITGERQINETTTLPILEICVIQRKDNSEWALPGGFVEPGESVAQALGREFTEEALNFNPNYKKQITKFFLAGDEIYKGYVDDPRNTDNAWIETFAMNHHDEDGTTVGKMDFKAGDDAKNVKWLDINKDVKLYASHAMIIEKVIKLRNADW